MMWKQVIAFALVIAFFIVYIEGRISWLEAQFSQLVNTAAGRTIVTSQTSCGVAATAVTSGGADTSRKSIMLTNNGTANIFVGGSGVTTANGDVITPGAAKVYDRQTAAFFCIVAAGTQTVTAMVER